MAGKAFIGLATVVVAATAGLSGCGGSEPSGFNGEVENNFVSSCVDSAMEGTTPPSESDAERLCGCMYDELKQRMTFEEFKAADESLREGGQMSSELASTLQAAASAAPSHRLAVLGRCSQRRQASGPETVRMVRRGTASAASCRERV